MTPSTITQSTVMCTVDFRSQINVFRQMSGESVIRNDQFIARVEDEIDDLGVCKNIAHPQSGVNMKAYDLTQKQMLLVGMRESKAVRRKVADWLEGGVNQPPALPDFSDPKVAIALLSTLQDAQSENKRLNGICNDLAGQLAHGITSPQFAKLLNGVNSQQVQGFLINKGYLKQYAGGELRGIRVTSKGRNSLYFVQKWSNRKDFQVGSAVLTEKGAKWLYSQYQKDVLPMLKNWNGSKSHDLFLSDAPSLSLEAV